MKIYLGCKVSWGDWRTCNSNGLSIRSGHLLIFQVLDISRVLNICRHIVLRRVDRSWGCGVASTCLRAGPGDEFCYPWADVLRYPWFGLVEIRLGKYTKRKQEKKQVRDHLTVWLETILMFDPPDTVTDQWATRWSRYGSRWRDKMIRWHQTRVGESFSLCLADNN